MLWFHVVYLLYLFPSHSGFKAVLVPLTHTLCSGQSLFLQAEKGNHEIFPYGKTPTSNACMPSAKSTNKFRRKHRLLVFKHQVHLKIYLFLYLSHTCTVPYSRTRWASLQPSPTASGASGTAMGPRSASTSQTGGRSPPMAFMARLGTSKASSK